jgi:hypothetical protein
LNRRAHPATPDSTTVSLAMHLARPLRAVPLALTRIAVGSIASPAGPACTVEIQYSDSRARPVELALAGAGEVLQDIGLPDRALDRHHGLPVGVGTGRELGHRRHVLLGESGGIRIH